MPDDSTFITVLFSPYDDARRTLKELLQIVETAEGVDLLYRVLFRIRL